MAGSPEASLHYSTPGTQFETSLSAVTALEELLGFPASYIYKSYNRDAYVSFSYATFDAYSRGGA